MLSCVVLALVIITMHESSTCSFSTTTEVTKQMTHFNHAGASPSSDAVVERILQHLRLEQAVGAYRAAAVVADDEMNHVYSSIAQLIGAPSSPRCSIAVVESATVGWTRLFAAVLAQRTTKTTTTLLVSEVEYAANLVACCRWARENGGIVLTIPSSSYLADDGTTTRTGTVCVRTLQSMLDGTYYYYPTTQSGKKERLDPATIAMVCITHIPTNAGVVNPVNEIGQCIAAYNKNKQQQNSTIFYLVDACQSVGQIPIHVGTMQCHALVASGRKYLAGPRGTGFLYISPDQDHLAAAPVHVDHFSTPIATVPGDVSGGKPLELDCAPRPDARRFEFWESSIANKLGLGVAVREFLLSEDRSNLIMERARYLYHKLQDIPGVRLHHGPPNCGIVTFWMPEHLSAQRIHTLLLAEHMETSVVPATSTPIDSSLSNVPDLVRASVSYKTTIAEIDQLCAVIRRINVQHSA